MPPSGNLLRLLAGLTMLGVWTGLVVFQIQGAEDLVSFLKYTLVGLASHYLTLSNPKGD